MFGTFHVYKKFHSYFVEKFTMYLDKFFQMSDFSGSLVTTIKLEVRYGLHAASTSMLFHILYSACPRAPHRISISGQTSEFRTAAMLVLFMV